jgi:hypothetical protein
MPDTPETVENVETTPDEIQETTPDLTSEIEKWKALARKNEQRAKENATAAQKLAEIENANKTELEKLTERAAAAEARAAQIELAATRNEIALEKGLTPSQAKRLVGSTRDELAADADELLADLKVSKPSAAPSSDAQGKQGEPVGQVKQITSRDQLKSMTPEQIVQAQAEGRLDALLNANS